VRVRGGCVTLAGMLDRLELRLLVNEVVGLAEGVLGIDDQLITADAVRPGLRNSAMEQAGGS